MREMVRFGFGILLFATISVPLPRAVADQTAVVIDGVVASVNGKPITLHELCARLNPPRHLSFKDASFDPEARQVLDAMILERLIQEEAESRKLSVTESEIDSYIGEVAKRNDLSMPAFENALAAQGKSMQSYKEQVKLDILKSKLASAVLQNGVNVSEDEIKSYIGEHPELSQSGEKMKLSHILIAREGRSSAEVEKRLSEIQQKLNAGEDFGKVAAAYSDSTDRQEGGSLGILSQRDLQTEILDAVAPLKEGEISQPVETSSGTHIFKLVQRFGSADASKELAEEVRKTLRQQKIESRMMGYFTNELYKQHAVDKKI